MAVITLLGNILTWAVLALLSPPVILALLALGLLVGYGK